LIARVLKTQQQPAAELLQRPSSYPDLDELGRREAARRDSGLRA
jgi:hypothetical protein